MVSITNKKINSKKTLTIEEEIAKELDIPVASILFSEVEELVSKEFYKTKKNKETKTKDTYLNYTYGISKQDFDTLYEAQNGKCVICEQKKTKKEMVVDHDHSTENVRGLLCSPCNLMLGHGKDNPKVLINAARYIEDSKYYYIATKQGDKITYIKLKRK